MTERHGEVVSTYYYSEGSGFESLKSWELWCLCLRHLDRPLIGQNLRIKSIIRIYPTIRLCITQAADKASLKSSKVAKKSAMITAWLSNDVYYFQNLKFAELPAVMKWKAATTGKKTGPGCVRDQRQVCQLSLTLPMSNGWPTNVGAAYAQSKNYPKHKLITIRIHKNVMERELLGFVYLQYVQLWQSEYATDPMGCRSHSRSKKVHSHSCCHTLGSNAITFLPLSKESEQFRVYFLGPSFKSSLS